MNQLVAAESSNAAQAVGAEDLSDFVTFVIRGQMFGIPVLKVQDILTPDHIAAIPLAPPEVKGSINLRGRIVTCIDVRVRLRLKANKEESNCMTTVGHHGGIYAFGRSGRRRRSLKSGCTRAIHPRIHSGGNSPKASSD